MAYLSPLSALYRAANAIYRANAALKTKSSSKGIRALVKLWIKCIYRLLKNDIMSLFLLNCEIKSYYVIHVQAKYKQVKNEKLSYRREAARCLVLLSILVSR